jgi:hypothetical protein
VQLKTRSANGSCYSQGPAGEPGITYTRKVLQGRLSYPAVIVRFRVARYSNINIRRLPYSYCLRKVASAKREDPIFIGYYMKLKRRNSILRLPYSLTNCSNPTLKLT